MTRYVIGDIHGRGNELNRLLKKCGFDYDKDQLIILGDVVDGGFETKKAIDILLRAKNRVLIAGNHDYWTLAWMKTGAEPPIWTTQGGRATMYSYGFAFKDVPKEHVDFLKSSVDYYLDEKNNLFVHGGMDPRKPIACQDIHTLMWDREIIPYVMAHGEIEGYAHVFIGHTSTALIQDGRFTPLIIDNLIMMDTGAGNNGGKLTIMDIDTFEYWQENITG
jgi:serine/threonine protein phosphatase 1